MVYFGEFLKTWSLRSNSVTRQVSFNRSKIGGKCQNWKIQMRHFGWFSNTVHIELIWSWQLVQVLGGFHLSDWPEPLVVMTRRQTPLRDLVPALLLQLLNWPLMMMMIDLFEEFSNCGTAYLCPRRILGIVKQRLATAIDTREESQQLGIIRPHCIE